MPRGQERASAGAALRIDRRDLAQAEAARRFRDKYLQEALANERALVTTLRARIAVTPQGPYRSLLDDHLSQTRQQVRAISRRRREVHAGPGLTTTGIRLARCVVGQALARGKALVDVVRGRGGEERLLGNAREQAATEELEIATYEALETAASAFGDAMTAGLAVRHREQQERMVEGLHREIPRLTQAAMLAAAGAPASYELAETAAAQRLRAPNDRDAGRAVGRAQPSPPASRPPRPASRRSRARSAAR